MRATANWFLLFQRSRYPSRPEPLVRTRPPRSRLATFHVWLELTRNVRVQPTRNGRAVGHARRHNGPRRARGFRGSGRSAGGTARYSSTSAERSSDVVASLRNDVPALGSFVAIPHSLAGRASSIRETSRSDCVIASIRRRVLSIMAAIARCSSTAFRAPPCSRRARSAASRACSANARASSGVDGVVRASLRTLGSPSNSGRSGGTGSPRPPSPCNHPLG